MNRSCKAKEGAFFRGVATYRYQENTTLLCLLNKGRDIQSQRILPRSTILDKLPVFNMTNQDQGFSRKLRKKSTTILMAQQARIQVALLSPGFTHFND